MPITDHYARLPLTSIFIDREGRQRRDLDTKGLVESIRLRGVLNPIIVEREPNPEGLHRLTAGERRHAACVELGLPDIPVRFVDELSPQEAQILELEENVKRAQLSWQDEARAILRIHNLYQELEVDWTQDKTAYQLGLSRGSISLNLTIAARLHEPQIANATTAREAYNIITRRAEREDAAKMDRLLSGTLELPPHIRNKEIYSADLASEIPPAPKPPPIVHDYKVDLVGDPARNILHESFLDWAPNYTGPVFNLIHCDFPYGIEVFNGPQSGANRHDTYDDSSDIHFQLLETFLIHLDRFASTSCHIVYWFSLQNYDRIRELITELAPTVDLWPHPLIWHKTDNTGIAADPKHGPRHVYETALLMSRGKRPIVNLVADVFDSATDHQFHIHTKPEPMLRYFFGMLVDEHTSLLDPTCGSGSAIRAAESLGAHTTLGMDTDEMAVGAARLALRQARARRTASLSQRLLL